VDFVNSRILTYQSFVQMKNLFKLNEYFIRIENKKKNHVYEQLYANVGNVPKIDQDFHL